MELTTCSQGCDILDIHAKVSSGYCSIQNNKDNKKVCIPENVQKLKKYNDDLSLIGFFLGFVYVNLLNMAFQISDVMHFIVL